MQITLEQARQLTWQLTREGSEDVAFLIDRDRVLFARHKRDTAAPREPTSAIVRLIQGIYQHEPAQARRIVRSRIFGTAVPTVMDLGMVRVAAKRMTAPISPAAAESSTFVDQFKVQIDVGAFEDLPSPLPQTPAGETSPEWGDSEWMDCAARLARAVPRDSTLNPLHALDRPVAALLVSREGTLLAHALNTNASNRTLHAELNLVRAHFLKTRDRLPEGSRIYVTLKPCKMCAGMIWHLAQEPCSLRVIYGEEDLGPNARNTVLDTASPERERVANGASERTCVIQALIAPTELPLLGKFAREI